MSQSNRLVRYAGIAILAAALLRAIYSVMYETGALALPHQTAPYWFAIYAVFVAAYAASRRPWLLGVQAVTGLCLSLIFPNYIVVCMLAVVTWQIALAAGTRIAFTVTIVQSIVLAAIKCTGETPPMMWIVLVTSFGFQVFAVCAAQLLRNETLARQELARANAELRAAQAVLAETAASEERLRISRDLHDVIGHSLTSLTIQLDVARRLADGDVAATVATARSISAELLEKVRHVVASIRGEPFDFRSALSELRKNTGDLSVHLEILDSVQTPDPGRAEAIVRCVQEVVTNAMRHSAAGNLYVSLHQEDNGIVVSARDDGRGGPIHEGRGLLGLRERFTAFGGVVNISNVNGSGVSIVATMPLANAGQ